MVIDAMLEALLESFGDEDFRVYVGTYPNDPATVDAVARVAERDMRVRLVIGPGAGPTTKADCLNTLWTALDREERAEGWIARAIVFHDAEDVVHPDEMRVHRALLGRYDVVQLPVVPLVDPGSRLVAGTYIDEFAEQHAKAMVARHRLSAPLPLAGVGCAVDRALLGRVAGMRDGCPFDADALTEDYELGLTTAMLGARQCFARVRDRDGTLIAVREYFPATVSNAVRQKARWMVGIALHGWDRLGWGEPTALHDHWMRVRDRRAPFAVLILLAAYIALLCWGTSRGVHYVLNSEPDPPPAGLLALLAVNGLMLCWRAAMRALFTWREHGVVEAAWSVPRMLVSNYIAILAARRSAGLYLRGLRGGAVRWDKTAHRFPDRARK